MVLPRDQRLRGRFVFDRLYQRGERLHGTWMTLRLLPAEPGLLRPDPRDSHGGNSRVAVVMVPSEALQRIPGSGPGTVRHRGGEVLWAESSRAQALLEPPVHSLGRDSEP